MAINEPGKRSNDAETAVNINLPAYTYNIFIFYCQPVTIDAMAAALLKQYLKNKQSLFKEKSIKILQLYIIEI